MNKILLASLATLLFTHAQAQQLDEAALSRKHLEALQRVMPEQYKTNPYALKPTGLQQRVIAQSNKYSPTSTLRKDSITYGYTGTRGSRFDFNSPLIGYNEQLPNTLEPTSYSLLAENVKKYSNDNLIQTSTATYRTDNKVNTLIIHYQPFSPYGDSSRTTNSYNVSGQATATDYIEYRTTGNIDRTTRYSYNNAGQRVADSGWIMENGAWQLARFAHYHYNTAGQLDTATFWIYDQNTPKPDNKSVYTYYPDGTLRTMSWSLHVSDTSLYSVHDTMGYTSGIDYFTFGESLTRYQDGSRLLINRRDRRENFPAANGSLDSSKFYTWNPDSVRWDIRALLRHSCNNFGNPDNIREFIFQGQTAYLSRTFTFYYETYEEVLGITDKEKSSSFAVYPNPFTNRLFIRSNDKTAMPGICQFRLMNMLGATVWSQQRTWNSGLSFNLPPDLVPGIYFFQVLKDDAPVHTTRLVKE